MKLITGLVTAFMLVGCVATPLPPDVPPSGHLRTAGGGFLISDGAPIYAMTFRIISPLPEAGRLEFYFENPRKGSPPLRETPVLKVDDEEILVQSQPLECIRNKRKYTVRVEVYRDASEDGILSAHYQDVEFRVPDETFVSMGLNEC